MSDSMSDNDTARTWQSKDNTEEIVIDLIGRAIHRANDDDLLDNDYAEANAQGWYSREAIQVLEDLRAAGLDIVNEFTAIVNAPLPPVSLRRKSRRSITGTPVPHVPYNDKLYGGTSGE